MIFRLATTKDASALLSIYAQYIQTPITFECTLPSEQDFLERIQSISSFYPYVVAEEDGCVVGYAYAHRHMQREAYQWNAELSVYIDQNKASKGIGTRLVQKVLTLLKLQGIKKVCSGITQPNVRSNGLHRKLGFTLVGTYVNAGSKAGNWYNVSWYQKDIADHDLSPVAPKALSEIPVDVVQRVLNKQ